MMSRESRRWAPFTIFCYTLALILLIAALHYRATRH